MVNNLSPKVWKQYISQNASPAIAAEIRGSGVVTKLGLTWVQQHAPAFFLSSKQVKILHEPNIFYKLILEQIQKAKIRVVLASLYLGNGPCEKNIVSALKTRLEEEPGLRVKILLDGTRGSRGENNSRKMVLPLLKKHKSCQVRLYQSPFIQSPFYSFLPAKYKEIAGLHHMKIYLFDNNFIITGANLSSDYFTNRQDRYMFVNDHQQLSDFIEGLVERVSEISLNLDAENQLSLVGDWPHHPAKTEPNTFNFSASSWIKNYYDSFIISQKKSDENDTVIFPLLEMGPFNIHGDTAVTTKLLRKCRNESIVYLTTGYFNLTESYTKTLIYNSAAKYKILMAHPEANGFYKAKGLASGIPYAYTNIASIFLQKLKENDQSCRIEMLEYKREGWTYHAKGLWLSSLEHPNPSLTMIGSPNFGERSQRRDLECQFLVATTDEGLQGELRLERDRLHDSCLPFTEETCKAPERRTPFWVRIIVHLFRSYL